MPDRKEFRDLVPPDEAHAAIESLALDPGAESVALEDARGRVLTERIDAGIDVPGFDRSGLDGYALRARDTFGATETDPATLDLVGRVTAGTKPDLDLEAGEAVEIATGAVMPPGADAMVMVERTDERATDGAGDEGADSDANDGDDVAEADTAASGAEPVARREVVVRTAVTPGENVMAAGADVAAGERSLGPGTRLTPREIGLLSALGVTEVEVRAKPRVGIISTGAEIVRPGENLDSAAGQIYDVNSTSIAAGVAEAGGEPVVYPHVGDDYDAMEAVLREAASECDVVLSSGSTSAGAVDVIYRLVEELGELVVHGVAVKPGKPMLVGRLDETGADSRATTGSTSSAGSPSDGGSAYVGLPGYPVSALTIFRTFVAPAIRDAADVPEPVTATREGEMATRERYTEGRLRYVPVGLVENGAGDLLVYPVDKGSGATTSLVEADGVVAMDPDTTQLDAGERVSVELFSPDVRAPTLFGVGEDDPVLARLLDRIERPRYLGFGSREGRRRLDEGIPDVAVTTLDPDESGGSTDETTPIDLGGWTREWGLAVPAGNPEGIEGLEDLVDRDLRFVNRPTSSGLRTSLADALAELADERGADRHDLVDAIRGFEFALRAHESPARAVAAGRADAGLGLRATVAKLDLEFVSVGEEVIRVLANPDRVEKPGVAGLAALLDGDERAGGSDSNALHESIASLRGFSRRGQ